MGMLTTGEEELLKRLEEAWQTHQAPLSTLGAQSKTSLTLQSYYASHIPEVSIVACAKVPGEFQAFHQQALECVKASGTVLKHTEESFALLEEMEERHASVVELTEALYQSFETLLKEVDQLDEKLKAMEAPLPYFTRITALAKAIGSHIDLSSKADQKSNVQLHVRPYSYETIDPTTPAFAQAIRTIDECTLYLQEHLDYKDTAMYLTAYHQLLENATHCLRNYAIAALESAKDQVITTNSKRSAHLDVLDPTSNYYMKFHVAAPACQAIRRHLEERMIATSADSLMKDVLNCYVNQRVALLMPAISNYLNALDNSSSDIVHVLRVGCQYIVRLCQAEHELFHFMFGAPPTASIFLQVELEDDEENEENEDAFQRLVVQLCYPLYQCIRPRMIKQQDLEILCESIEVLRSEIMEAQIQPRAIATDVLEAAIERMVGDAQERLILCTQKYIRDEIEGFVPQPTDLNYPEKLQAASVYATWYPTLEHTLMCLSKVYRYLNMNIFEELAQEAVSICTASLKMASADITVQKGPCDGGLFLIKHLLTLRERITPFDIQFSITEKSLDFTSTTDAVGNMLSDAFSFSLENSLLGLLTNGIPLVNTTTSDVKKDLEHELKRSCTNFIDYALQTIAGPLMLMLRKATSSKPPTLPPIDQITAMLRDLLPQMQSQVLKLQQAIHTYLNHASTESILFQPIQKGLLGAMEHLKPLLEVQFPTAQRVDCDAQVQVVMSFILQL
ncbi:oligomeric Golgi complex subunit [Thraustotheca clavata]|uniref:Conserved oligomeric Golgi complex subunit 3 n=1 Tax=Thraustotheca clavata TaxID=74557 RepID=A0A1V9ZXD7_9STRA|nr:oligomeric Golgi complex subunit [Thraustotheca clavata]